MKFVGAGWTVERMRATAFLAVLLQPQAGAWSQWGSSVLVLLTYDSLSSQQLFFFTRYLVQLGFH